MRSFMAFTPHKNVIMTQLGSIRWTECVALVGEKRYEVFIEISEGKGSLGMSVHRWEDNIENGIKEIGWEGED